MRRGGAQPLVHVAELPVPAPLASPSRRQWAAVPDPRLKVVDQFFGVEPHPKAAHDPRRVGVGMMRRTMAMNRTSREQRQQGDGDDTQVTSTLTAAMPLHTPVNIWPSRT
jgi:hypothetical protein